MNENFSFVGVANAQSGEAAPMSATQSGFASFIPLVLMMVVFYFLLIRPQQKKIKAQAAMIAALKKGDKVLTASGITGTIEKIETETGIVHVEIAKDVTVKMLKTAISELITK